jgi:hypothetical protein
MKVEFFDRQDKKNPMNGLEIVERAALERILGSLRSRSPFFFELVGENGYTLLVGLAKSIGCAQFSRTDGEPPYLMATLSNLKAGNEREGQDVEFLIGNTPTPVRARYCLPLDVIMQVATRFQQSGARSPDVYWEELS